MLSRRSVLLLGAGFLFPAIGFAKGPVAVVASLMGGAIVRSTDQKAKPVQVLDRLEVGVLIEVQPKSTVRIILLNGRFYEMRGGAIATVDASGLIGIKGDVRELKPLPPVPTLTPIADLSADVAGVTTIRGPWREKAMYPQRIPVIASHVTLNFAPGPEVSNYSVVLNGADQNILLRISTQANSVEVPSELLKPGTRYFWRVRAFGDAGVLGEQRATFVTISEKDLARRSAFIDALHAEDEGIRLGLIASIDQQIGLLAEACSGFESALRLRPADPALQNALAAAKAELAEASKPAK